MTAFVAFALLLWFPPVQNASSSPGTDCQEWHECQRLAVEAYAEREYERFHDFAWRAVQTGPPRDPSLLHLLARAQSLSGRPHDALVMLGRLVEMGFTGDVPVNDDFRAVRQLRQWPELEASMAAVRGSGKSSPVAMPGNPVPSIAAPSVPVSPAARIPASTETNVAPPTSPFKTEDALRISGTLAWSGLAYDRVSSRFVLADAPGRKLVVLDERSHRLVDLVTSASAGFYDVTGLEIDVPRGNLWVVSAEPATAATGQPTATALHKLQLVSGRPLDRVPVSNDLLPSRLEDVAITPNGTVLVLDTIGRRILQLRQPTHDLAPVAALSFNDSTSLAAVDDHIVYVAHSSGISRVDTARGKIEPLASSPDIRLSGFSRIRWSGDSLIGVQHLSDGGNRAVRVRVAGGRATRIDIIESDIPLTGSAATVSGGEFFFLVQQPSRDGSDIVIRRSRLR